MVQGLGLLGHRLEVLGFMQLLQLGNCAVLETLGYAM